MDFSFMVCHHVGCCKFVATNTAEILEWIQGNLLRGIDNCLGEAWSDGAISLEDPGQQYQ